MKVSSLLVLFACSNSFAQLKNYQDLIDTAISKQGCLFVCAKPLSVIRLDKKEMRDYADNLKGWSKQILDTTMISQIIQNAKAADTTLWTDIELSNSLLVSQRNELISMKYALQKLNPANKKQINFYKKQVHQFNSTETIDRTLCYFSRPVFDNSKTFAVVQWDDGRGYLSGAGGIILYQLQGDKWNEVGIIMNWRY